MTIKKRAKILYIRNVDTSWTKRDKEILRTQFDVDDICLKSKKSAFQIANPFKLLKYDKIFCWFGSLNFLPLVIVSKLLRKEIIIVAGGFDVANVPSISYGGFHRNCLSVIMRKLIFKLASKVITVSNFNSTETIVNAGVKNAKIQMIYHGFLPVKKSVTDFDQRKNQIISVGAINPETMARKGHLHFLQLAKELPQFQFILAGRYDHECKEYIESLKLTNLKMTGFLSDEDLSKLFSESKFYVQLSEHEAFGCSVVEAGIHGCNLIISKRAALVEVINGHGNSFEPKESKVIAQFIKDNMNNAPFTPQAISENLLKKFSMKKREERLLQSIHG